MAAGVQGSVRSASGKGPRARGTLAFCILTTLMFLAVSARLVQLQVMEGDSHTREVAGMVIKPVAERDRRGSIVDSRGIPLAVSVPVWACAIDPKMLWDNEQARPEQTVANLSEILEMTPDETARLEKRVNRKYVPRNSTTGEAVPIRFAWVKRPISEEQHTRLTQEMAKAKREASEAWRNRRRWQKLAGQMKVARNFDKEKYCRDAADGWKQHALRAEGRYAGVYFPPEFSRVYPQGKLASHILGFSDIDGNGIVGMERSFNEKLRGVTIKRLVARDARSQPLSALVQDGRSSEGMTVELTIDSVIQAIVEEELQATVDAKKASTPEINAHAVVMDPYTGNILAMANYPTYDPNHPRTDPDTGAKVDERQRRNDAVSAVQEPGSTFKPLMICAALEEKVANLDEMVDCATFRMNNGKRTIKDIHPYGRMTLEMAVVKSSNPGMVKTGLKLGPEKMREYVLKWGFGERTGSGLPGESRGMVTSEEKWSEWTMGSVPMGYEIAVTTLQMAAAYSAIANGGMLPRPNIIRAVYDATGGLIEKSEPDIRRRVISESVTADMRRVLRKVVTDGTGRRANIAEYELGGKTGTANMVQDGKKGYAKDRKLHTANFVALAPWDKPKVIVCVSVRGTDEYGGTAGSPAGAAISRRVLGYWGVPTANGSPIRADIMPKMEFNPPPPPAVHTQGAPDDDNFMDDVPDPRWMDELVDDPEAMG